MPHSNTLKFQYVNLENLILYTHSRGIQYRSCLPKLGLLFVLNLHLHHSTNCKNYVI